ncbi:hypothetical protein TSOC_015281, partial [Tetrabaena socialis]
MNRYKVVKQLGDG